MSHSGRIEARDFWRGESGCINFLEAKALFCALDAFKARIRDSRVDIHNDNKPLLGLWKNDGGSNSEINKVLTAVLLCSLEFNFSIQLRYSTPLQLRTWLTLCLDSIRISVALCQFLSSLWYVDGRPYCFGGPAGARHVGRQQPLGGGQILLELQALSEAKVVPGATVVKLPRLSFTPEVHTLCYHRGHR